MSREWIKVRRGWWNSLSHRDISGDALNIGPTLMHLADASWEPGEDEAPLMHTGTGKPLTLAQIAREVRWSPKRTGKALADLVAVRTLVVRDDGAWVFPKYGQHQESESARRVRKHRAKKAGPVTETVTVTTEEKKKRGEGEGDNVTQQQPPEQIDAHGLWSRVVDVCAKVGPKGRAFKLGLTPHPGVIDLVQVWGHDEIVAMLENVAKAMAEGAIEPRWWRWQMFDPKNWRILEDQVLRWKAGEIKPQPRDVDDLPLYTGKGGQA